MKAKKSKAKLPNRANAKAKKDKAPAEHRGRFEQLLDDAVLAVKKK